MYINSWECYDFRTMKTEHRYPMGAVGQNRELHHRAVQCWFQNHARCDFDTWLERTCYINNLGATLARQFPQFRVGIMLLHSPWTVVLSFHRGRRKVADWVFDYRCSDHTLYERIQERSTLLLH
jgi:hypothetical protein